MSGASLEKYRYWERQVAAWKQSKLGNRKWCKENGVAYSTFCYWKSRISKDAEDKKKNGFIEICSSVDTQEKVGFNLRIGSVAIELQHNFDETALCRIVTMLGRIQ